VLAEAEHRGGDGSRERQVLLRVLADGVSASSNLTSTMEQVAIQVFKDLHA
jgi:hypothetical protein